LLMPEVRGEWPDWFELKGNSNNSNITIEVCRCRRPELNEFGKKSNCDFFVINIVIVIILSYLS